MSDTKCTNYGSIDLEKTSENNSLNSKSFLDQESFLVNKLKTLLAGEHHTEDFLKLSKKEQIDWLCDYIKLEEDGIKNDFSNLPNDIIRLFVAVLYEDDCENSLFDNKPEWLDLEKFKKGQKFARDHTAGLSCSQLVSIFMLFSYEEGIKTLILTGKSCTPYLAFKRYLSMAEILKNWYSEDPWTKGSAAYNDIKKVRRMHTNARKRLKDKNSDEIDAVSKIENLYCLTRDILLRDFQASCPDLAFGQCPFAYTGHHELKDLIKGLNQAEMILTQFGFMGLIILYPKHFGIHNATDEDFKAFCHTWRVIGYLLGIYDEFNFCRGTLSEIKQRGKYLLDFWIIPNFRKLCTNTEHLMRCTVDGLEYYFPGPTFELVVLYLSEILNLHTPELYSSLSYWSWIKYIFFKYYLQYACQVTGIRTLSNLLLTFAIDNASNFSVQKHEELKKRSEETLKKANNKS